MPIENKCCICNSQSHERFLRSVEDYILHECKKCNLQFLKYIEASPSDFIADSESNTHPDVEYWSLPYLYKKYQFIFDHFFSERISRIQSFQEISKNKVLDVGTGYGLWSNYLIDQHYQVIGIDPSLNINQYVTQINSFPFVNIDFERYQTNQTFDQIHMFDVLEHFLEPKEMLKKAHSLLNDDGLIYIQVPNVLGIKYPFGHSLGLPHHLWQFNRKSLTTLLSSSGFTPLKDWTGTQGIIGAYENGGPSLITQFKWKLANFCKRGNRIQIIARKSSCNQ